MTAGTDIQSPTIAAVARLVRAAREWWDAGTGFRAALSTTTTGEETRDAWESRYDYATDQLHKTIEGFVAALPATADPVGDAVRQAVMAERERCAGIVDDERQACAETFDDADDRETLRVCAKSANLLRRAAAAIRAGTP